VSISLLKLLNQLKKKSFKMSDIDYKFRENELISELQTYIDNTYAGHYGQGGLQSSEVIVDRGRGLDFFLGNVDKYNARYGKKGSANDHRKDIMKILHYALLALYEHDRQNPVDNSGMTVNQAYKISYTLPESSLKVTE